MSNAREIAVRLLSLAQEYPDEEIEVLVFPEYDDEGEPCDSAYGVDVRNINLSERTYRRFKDPTPRVFHEIHIRP